MATMRPNSVVTKASEIPEDRDLASPVPSVISLKVLIIPVTVLSSPISGAVAVIWINESVCAQAVSLVPARRGLHHTLSFTLMFDTETPSKGGA